MKTRSFETIDGNQQFRGERVAYNGKEGYIWTRTIYRDDMHAWTPGGNLFAPMRATREQVVELFSDDAL